MAHRGLRGSPRMMRGGATSTEAPGEKGAGTSSGPGSPPWRARGAIENAYPGSRYRRDAGVSTDSIGPVSRPAGLQRHCGASVVQYPPAAGALGRHRAVTQGNSSLG